MSGRKVCVGRRGVEEVCASRCYLWASFEGRKAILKEEENDLKKGYKKAILKFTLKKAIAKK